SEDSLILDAVSRRNPEIDRNLGGGRENTLSAVLDHCAASMGSRLLTRWLHRPIRDHEQLQRRQNAVGALLDQYRYEALRPLLKDIGDIERILSRVALRSARPRDLARLRDALACFPALREQLASLDAPRLAELREDIRPYPAL